MWAFATISRFEWKILQWQVKACHSLISCRVYIASPAWLAQFHGTITFANVRRPILIVYSGVSSLWLKNQFSLWSFFLVDFTMTYFFENPWQCFFSVSSRKIFFCHSNWQNFLSIYIFFTNCGTCIIWGIHKKVYFSLWVPQ